MIALSIVQPSVRDPELSQTRHLVPKLALSAHTRIAMCTSRPIASRTLAQEATWMNHRHRVFTSATRPCESMASTDSPALPSPWHSAQAHRPISHPQGDLCLMITRKPPSGVPATSRPLFVLTALMVFVGCDSGLTKSTGSPELQGHYEYLTWLLDERGLRHAVAEQAHADLTAAYARKDSIDAIMFPNGSRPLTHLFWEPIAYRNARSVVENLDQEIARLRQEIDSLEAAGWK